jgi:PTS system nitrogen regulatory IIA component
MQEGFDAASLARLLQITPGQVERMADRGRVPGRKVGGEWRFSQAEIHHWLEDAIGTSELSDRSKVEAWLKDHGPPEEARVSQWLRPETINCPMDARTRSSVIQKMVQLVAQTGLLWDEGKMRDAVRDREHLHPTALDNGVALLHPRRPLGSILAEPVLAIGSTQQGIAFGGPRGELTDVFFLICSVDDTGHLQMLAKLSRMLADPEFVLGLRTEMEASVLHYWICQYEEQVELDST